MYGVVRRLLYGAAAAGTALAALSIAAPWIGLGRDESFVGFVLFGWTRKEAAIAGAGAAIGAMAALGIVFSFRFLRWRGTPDGAVFIGGLSAGPRRILDVALPATIATALTLLGFVAIAELYWRTTTPFLTSRWISRFDPDLGFVLPPDTEVRLTNGVDFWVRARTNASGFLDREWPKADAPPGTCRIVFVGDSFVEAAQVPISEKFHVVLESIAKARAGVPPIEAAAIGYSGTGQTAQMPLFARFAPTLRPDLVVLVFVANDFEDNSAALRALTHGWHPRHPPRPFYVRNLTDSRFELVPIDPEWRSRLGPSGAGAVTAGGWLDGLISGSSYFYAYLRGHWLARFPSKPVDEGFAARANWLRSIAGFAHALDGWDSKHPVDPFEADQEALPPVFREALAATNASIEAYRDLARRDGFHLAVLGTHTLRSPHGGDGESGQVRILRRILEPLNIPYIDQIAHIARSGGRIEEAHFSRDGHWNAKGHRWAAEAVLAHLIAHPESCRRGGPDLPR